LLIFYIYNTVLWFIYLHKHKTITTQLQQSIYKPRLAPCNVPRAIRSPSK